MERVRAVRPGAIETAHRRMGADGAAPASAGRMAQMNQQKGRTMSEPENAAAGMGAVDARRDRAIGAFVGLAVGDALGTTIEFRARDTYPPVTDMIGGGPFGLRPGEWTDDTSMALCLAESLVANAGTINPKDLAERFVRWWKRGENSVTGRCFDIGAATRSGLESFLRTGRPEGSADPRAAGNGGIMRLRPSSSPQEATRRRRPIWPAPSPRHPRRAGMPRRGRRPRPVLAAGVDGRGRDALTAGADANLQSSEAASRRRRVLAWQGPSRDPLLRLRRGHARGGAVGGRRSGMFEEAVMKAVNLGDDADTVGAVAGQIAAPCGDARRSRRLGQGASPGARSLSRSRTSSWDTAAIGQNDVTFGGFAPLWESRPANGRGFERRASWSASWREVEIGIPSQNALPYGGALRSSPIVRTSFW